MTFTNISNFQGAGPSVPKYLRFEGQVRNRHLGKRDCALLIKDLWREKAASDAESEDGSREDMDEFLYTYLQRRFGIEQMIYEWSYNLHDACQRYAHDQKIGEFWRILTGQVSDVGPRQVLVATAAVPVLRRKLWLRDAF